MEICRDCNDCDLSKVPVEEVDGRFVVDLSCGQVPVKIDEDAYGLNVLFESDGRKVAVVPAAIS